MANENAPIGQINPANLIGQFKPQTDATSNFVQAMRAGVINANDIVQGIDRHQQAKVQLSAQQLALSEASNPTAMAARQAQNQLSLATANAQLPLVQPLAESQARAMQTSDFFTQLSRHGITKEDLNEQLKWGYPLTVDVSKPVTAGFVAQVKTNSRAIAEWHGTKAGAKSDFTDAAKTMTAAGEAGMPSFSRVTGRDTTAAQTTARQKLADPSMGPMQWEAAGKPGLAEFYGSPGTVGGPAPAAGRGAPVVETLQPAPAPAPVRVAPVVETLAQAPVGSGTGLAPETAAYKQVATAQSSWPAVEVGKAGVNALNAVEVGKAGINALREMEARKAAGESYFIPGPGAEPKDKSLTDSQAKMFNFVQRAEEANRIFAGLSDQYNPGAAHRYVTSSQLFPNFLQSADEQAYRSGMSIWSQGLLRLESGAAIAYKEQKWYERAFFPVPGDTQNTMIQKARARHMLETSMATALTSTRVGPELNAAIEKVAMSSLKRQADALGMDYQEIVNERAASQKGAVSPWVTGKQPGSPAPTAAKPAGSSIKLTGKTVVLDGNGNLTVQ